MNELYETGISNARWWAYDIPGNIGWIIWLVGLIRCMRTGVGFFEALAIVPGVLMLTGVAELISERAAGLDRVLPKKRVLRGFGALTLGGVLAFPAAVVGLVTEADVSCMLWMLGGAVLCAVFAGLCLRGYKKRV